MSSSVKCVRGQVSCGRPTINHNTSDSQQPHPGHELLQCGAPGLSYGYTASLRVSVRNGN